MEVNQLATYRVGQQTNSAVLPQQRSLESAPADNPRIGDETGLGRHQAPGAVHVRGEMRDAAPGVARVTPDREVGEQAREGHPAVFVLDKRGTPLQPTTSARARKLLKQGRAVVARHTPFVIRLKDRAAAESSVDGVELGIDPGSKHIGIALFTARAAERRGRFSIQIDHRGAAIRKKMQQRAAYRGGRRTRNLRFVRHKHFRLLQRADGYGYTTQPEERQTLRRGIPTGSEP